MTIEINRQTALDLMERAVSEKGEDFIYPGSNGGDCQYQRGGEPSCLVGHALFYAGVTIEDLARMDKGMAEGSEPKDSAIRTLVREHGDDLPFRATNAATEAFAQAQKFQDFGHSWGNALASGRDAARWERDSL